MAHTHTERPHKNTIKTHFLLQILALFAWYDCLGDSDDVCDLKMAFKMPQEFPTASLDITNKRPPSKYKMSLPARDGKQRMRLQRPV